ncbi:hypothetical protein EGH24_13730 [Halonotius terrestris]|uniref:Uncharacterized protein n=1 Tax=Halonotius terrestris TaxID=2487750 RepID=A0A8J8TBM0_9EURY|nr:hypothetical protein [Halonotius terrestris]TQQ78577.1 hypothetical protein EGH24_13730 [Halonotius terrestris]
MTPSDGPDLSRREFMLAGSTSLLALQGSVEPQLDTTQTTDEYQFRGVAHLIGPASARPAPDDPFFEDKVAYAYVYEDHSGARSLLTPDRDAWHPLNFTQQQAVFSSDDLPAPSNGTHTLAGNTAYFFNGFVTSPYGLDISNGPVLAGRHAAVDGFIHTGGNTAIVGTDGGYFQRKLYVHAPGGTLYDLTADQTTEMLVTDSAFSDAAGIAPIGSLGTVDGYRVPTWKNCNFEDFASGLTFDGTPDKIFITASPFRTVTAPGVDILTLAASSDVAIVDFVDNYVKNVQSDTVMWRVEAGGAPTEVFQYRGTVHDTSFTPDNAIVGPNADPTVEPFWVADSHPVRDSSVVGELYLTGDTTVSLGSAGAWSEVNGTTATGNESERTQQPNNGTIEYIGAKDVNVQVTVTSSFTGANGDTYELAVAKNGTVEPASTMEVEAQGQNAPVTLATGAIEDLQPGDTVSVQVRNNDAANDPTFLSYLISYMD